jgi:hypothetical protein
MRRIIHAVVLLVFFVSGISFPQVVIKEKVGIKPDETNDMQTSIKEHKFKYTLTWNPSEDSRGNIQIITCSDDTVNSGWSSNGITSISFVGNGRHHFLIQEQRYFNKDFGGWGWYDDNLPGTHWQEFVDDIVINNSNGILGSFNGVNGYFNLHINGSICPSSLAVLSIDSLQWGECDGPNWYETDPLDLQIIEGSDFVKFYDRNSVTDLGNFVQLQRFGDINNIVLKAKENAPLVSESQKIKVEANINGVIVSEVTEFPANNFSIDPWARKDTIFNKETDLVDLFVYNECKELAGGIKINVEITEGNNYGSIINPLTEERVQSLEDFDHSSGYLAFYYIADGVQVDSIVSVNIRISTTDPKIPEVNQRIFIRFPEIKVIFKPEELQPGDTSRIFIKKRNPDGSLGDFPEYQNFEIGMTEGCSLGKLSVCNGEECNSGAYFYSVPLWMPIYFIADSSIDSSSNVKFRIGLKENIINGKIITSTRNMGRVLSANKGEENKSIQKRTALLKSLDTKVVNSNLTDSVMNRIVDPRNKIYADYSGGEYCSDFEPSAAEYIFCDLPINKTIEILLGETKYFGVKKKVEDGIIKEIKIEEIKAEYGEKPEFPENLGGWEWIKSDTVWGNNPVSIDTGKNYGRRMGVYWETEKPVWDGNINKGNLDKGIIRLVGRYWSADSIYEVKLEAKISTDLIKNIITVIRPKELGDKHHRELDVLEKIINIDSLCISNGGKMGTPPQFIKGHMEKETSFQNSFRYEPRLDISIQNNKSKRKKYLEDYSYYTVISSSMGTVPMPENHINVKPISYISIPQKIGDYLVDKIANYIRYPKKDKNDKWLDPFFVGYKKGKPSLILQNEYSKIKDSLDLQDAMNHAIDSLKKWLKTDDFKDGSKYVQSRIFSSYGILQQVFYYACTDMIAGYAISNDKQKPESLNEIKNSIMAYSENMENKLQKKFGNQWVTGFEGDWSKILQAYNKYEAGYGEKVMELSKQYLPK